jgi:hypothetical protein
MSDFYEGIFLMVFPSGRTAGFSQEEGPAKTQMKSKSGIDRAHSAIALGILLFAICSGVGDSD